jgi:hypothetical protein
MTHAEKVENYFRNLRYNRDSSFWRHGRTRANAFNPKCPIE